MTLKLIINSLILFSLATVSACNADSKVNNPAQNPSASTKAAEPAPQPGGYSNIDNAKLQELLDKGVTLIDIRREDEWKQTGIIKGAKPITFFDNTGRINPNFVPEFTAAVKPDQPVALICRTGNRTKVASQAIAQQLGYKKVMNVTHGMMGWLAEKRPVVPYNK